MAKLTRKEKRIAREIKQSIEQKIKDLGLYMPDYGIYNQHKELKSERFGF